MGELSTNAARRAPVTQDRGGLFENARGPVGAITAPAPSAQEPEDDDRSNRLAYVQEQKRLESLQLDQALDRLGQLIFRGQVSNVGPRAESLAAAPGIGLFGDRGRAFDAYA